MAVDESPGAGGELPAQGGGAVECGVRAGEARCGRSGVPEVGFFCEIGVKGGTGTGPRRGVGMSHFEEAAEGRHATVGGKMAGPEGPSVLEDFGASCVAPSETASNKGVMAGTMLDASRDCAAQCATGAATGGAEDSSSDGLDLKGKEQLTEAKGEISAGEVVVRRYAKSVLETLRFVGVGEQQRKWNEIHQGLGTVVSREYDGISANSQKNVSGNYDQRQTQEKKKEAPTRKNELFVENVGKVSDALEISGILNGNCCEEESWTVEEEPCDEEDSDDEYDSIQRPAFYVEGEPDFESGPPQDGLEYLRRVRWEAAQMPKVKVAKFDRSKWSSEQTPYMPKIPEIAKSPENLSPSKQWVDTFLADFSELRKAFSEFENSTDRALGTPTEEDSSEDSPGLRMRRHIPTISAILDMDSVSRTTALRNRIKTFESASALLRENCLWMFALCAAVDTPFDADTSSCLRCLLRKCCNLLSKKSEFDEEVAMLNILIAISGKYFGQSEN